MACSACWLSLSWIIFDTSTSTTNSNNDRAVELTAASVDKWLMFLLWSVQVARLRVHHLQRGAAVGRSAEEPSPQGRRERGGDKEGDAQRCKDFFAYDIEKVPR